MKKRSLPFNSVIVFVLIYFQVAQLQKDSNSGLGISLEGTVDVEDGREVRPHHYIRNILPEGPVGKNEVLQSGDELLEVINLFFFTRITL